MKKYFLILIAFLAFVMSSCSPQTAAKIKFPEKAVEETAALVFEIINDNAEEFESNMQGKFLLLDVRTKDEYDEGHIEGSTLIPVDELEGRLSEIEEYKKLPVLVYCRSGNKSVTASNILLDAGFEEVHNLLGGIGAWNNYKSEQRYLGLKSY